MDHRGETPHPQAQEELASSVGVHRETRHAERQDTAPHPGRQRVVTGLTIQGTTPIHRQRTQRPRAALDVGEPGHEASMTTAGVHDLDLAADQLDTPRDPEAQSGTGSSERPQATDADKDRSRSPVCPSTALRPTPLLFHQRHQGGTEVVVQIQVLGLNHRQERDQNRPSWMFQVSVRGGIGAMVARSKRSPFQV